ncbi:MULTISPECIES: hypothetical protein [Curtobacterium]|uniref:hypothetical protein n=1 Tax=Curtobacterium flaccumfaciens TaxID=2035 RepID=UPI003102FEA0
MHASSQPRRSRCALAVAPVVVLVVAPVVVLVVAPVAVLVVALAAARAEARSVRS